MPARPNVILVITDDQGYGDIGCHGNPVLRTPHLDRMAGESLQLDDHHHDPLCSPSRAALLTGQYASRNGVWHVIAGRHLLDPAARTMGDIFRQNGYRTAMYGKWHLGDNYPFAPRFRGFDESLCHRGGGIGELPDYWGNSYIDDCYFLNGEPLRGRGYCTDVFFDRALSFIARAADQPFFIYLATNAMHAPHIVPEACAQPYLEAGVAANRANFYGMIANFDENMGRLFASLSELDLDQNTIVIFTSDHGTAAGYDPESGDGYNAGLRGKKGSVYEGGHRVSCFLRWPGHLPGGKQIRELTAHIDLLPTLAELCSLRIDSEIQFDGISLTPAIVNEARLPSRAVITHLQPDRPRKWHHCAVMRSHWRLINGVELYDLRHDPGQGRDVAGDYPAIVAGLRADYEGWWRELEASFAADVPIPIGTDFEDPVLLSARDWHPTQGRVPWRQAWIDDPEYDANGYWLIDVRRAGQYRIALRSHPPEAGRAALAAAARLQIDERQVALSISEDDEEAVFSVRLAAGQQRLQTWLCHPAAGRQRGAYYVYVSRVDD